MSRGDDPDHKYQKERERVKDSALSEKDTKAVLDFLSAHHPDLGGEKSLSYNSLENYGRALRLIGKNSDCDLLEHDLQSLRQVFEDFLSNLSKQTVRQRQAGAIKFYRYHDLDVDPDEIALTETGNGSSVDERDMFTREEIQALREACTNTRDRALLELLIYTGQRIRAIQTLRIENIDIEEGVYYLNTDELGLKGADKTGRKRPLLGAKKAVREWIQHHPTGKPGDYLITPLPSATNTTTDKGDYLSMPSIRNRLWTIAERAEVYDKESGEGKSPNPHNFRHYFVTTAHRRYDMDPSTIKWLIGHGADSTVMETTYSHLTDEDRINQVRKDAEGVGEEPEEDETAFTPESCPTCNENLGPGAKACPACGSVFSPDAKSVQDSMQGKVRDAKEDAESLDEYKDLDELEQLVNDNPELVDVLKNMAED
jgi:integrase/recombinase XerD